MVAIDLAPCIEMFDLLGCACSYRPELGGYVPVVDAQGRTSLPHIFAAGDCAGIADGALSDPAHAEAGGRRAALAAATLLGGDASPDESVPPPAPALVDREGPRLRWLNAHVRRGGDETTACQCEEVRVRDLIGVRPPRYLAYDEARFAKRNLHALAVEGQVNQDQIKRLTRAGMGACQGRRCRDQVQTTPAAQGNCTPADIPMASYRAPLRPLPIGVLADQDEAPEIRANWSAWFGIASQWQPHWLEPVEGEFKARARFLEAPKNERVRRSREMNETLVRADASGKKGASVVIVGGGVTGLSTAWWLAQEGVDVLVLDKGIVGWEASGRNGGGTTHTVSTLFKEEQRLWPMMDALLGYPTEFRPYRIRVGLNQGQLDLYWRIAGVAIQQGFTADGLDPRQVRELVPLVGENIAGGVFCNYGGHANPQRTVQAYAWALQDRGGRIRQHTAVTDIVTAGGRVVAVETDEGRIGCDVLVMATGPDEADGGKAGREGAGRPGARRDDRDRAVAADGHRRHRRRRALRPPDAARQPRLWRRAA